MPNSIKQSGQGPALQVTKEARTAGLAVEATGDELSGVERWEDLADVRVYGFNHALLVIDRDEVATENVAELVATIARDTSSIYRGENASVRPAGNGCMVSLPGLSETGLRVGDTAPAHPAPGVLFITEDTADGVRLAEDVRSIRRSQVEGG